MDLCGWNCQCIAPVACSGCLAKSSIVASYMLEMAIQSRHGVENSWAVFISPQCIQVQYIQQHFHISTTLEAGNDIASGEPGQKQLWNLEKWSVPLWLEAGLLMSLNAWECLHEITCSNTYVIYIHVAPPITPLGVHPHQHQFPPGTCGAVIDVLHVMEIPREEYFAYTHLFLALLSLKCSSFSPPYSLVSSSLFNLDCKLSGAEIHLFLCKMQG